MAFCAWSNIRTSHTYSENISRIRKKLYLALKGNISVTLFSCQLNRLLVFMTIKKKVLNHNCHKNSVTNLKTFLYILQNIIFFFYLILLWNGSWMSFIHLLTHPPLFLFPRTSNLTAVMWRYRSKTVYFIISLLALDLNLAFTHA